MSNMKVSELNSREVFSFFDDICKIPRESGHCEKISSYLLEFAKGKGLYSSTDSCGNVLIRKPASKGYETYETIILQGHMDMVCEKEHDISFDFSSDAIKAYVDGDFIKAEGTTLGGDNGIGISMMLAILSDESLMHPEIEALFTVDEETDMGGAFGFDCSVLHGSKIINLDSEYEGILMCSCAGGIDAVSSIPVNFEEKRGNIVKLSIGGLKGGHSGVEIDKGRANANVLMGRVLLDFSNEINFGVCSYYGGERETAIAPYSECKLIVDDNSKNTLLENAKLFEKTFRAEYKNVEDELYIKVEDLGYGTASCLDSESKVKVIGALACLPDGMQEMCADMPGLVQTSLNIGKAKLTKNSFNFTNSIRSSVDSKKYALGNKVSKIVELLGGKTVLQDEYPGWAFNKDSKLTETILQAYLNVCNLEAKVDAVHAGMECGIFAASIPNLDCVSIGPTMGDVHTPDEYLSISSTKRTYSVLKNTLEMCKYER